MLTSVLIFNLSGGFTDMKKNLISIIKFTQEHNYKFTIKLCTARPQTFNEDKSDEVEVDDEVIKNDYMYNIKNLFDEKTFTIYDNYISFETINKFITKDNTFDFYNTYKPWNIFKDKKFLVDYKSILKNTNKDYIYMGNHFHFYADYDVKNVLFSKEFNSTIIPSSKILNEYNRFITNVNFEYNFLHYRYEKDIKNMVNGKKDDVFVDITLDNILQSNMFENNNLKTYVATTSIEDFFAEKKIKNPLDKYNIFYNKNKMRYFDENAFVDFLIGMNSVEVVAFSNSGFSIVLNKLKNKTDKYYDLIL